MEEITVRKKDEIVWSVADEQPNLTQINHYHIYVPEQSNNDSWLSVVANLNPVTQIAGLVSLITLGYFSLSFISIAFSGLAVFSLAIVGIVTNFITTIAIGMGILLLVIIGVTAVLKV